MAYVVEIYIFYIYILYKYIYIYNPTVNMFFPIVQVWNQNGRIPYITYEYTVLRDSLPPIPPPPVYTGADSSAAEVSVEVGGLLPSNASVHRQTGPQSVQGEVGADGQKGQETNEVYEESAAIDCEQDSPKYTGEDHETSLLNVDIVLRLKGQNN